MTSPGANGGQMYRQANDVEGMWCGAGKTCKSAKCG